MVLDIPDHTVATLVDQQLPHVVPALHKGLNGVQLCISENGEGLSDLLIAPLIARLETVEE